MTDYPNWNQEDGAAVIDSVNLPLFITNRVLDIHDSTTTTVGVVQILDAYPSTVSHTDATTSYYVQQAIIDAVISGNSFQGDYDASTNLFPALNSLGEPIDKGDFWIISVGGTLGSIPVYPNYKIYALVDVPGQTAGNWYIDTSGKSFNADQFEIIANEVSLKVGGITLDLFAPGGVSTNGFVLSSMGDTLAPKYREITTNNMVIGLDTTSINIDTPQDIGTGSNPSFLGVIITNASPSRVMVTDGLKLTTTSTVTSAELLNVGGTTSNIQTQLNGKQASGNYITALTGDVTASGPGSVAATIANAAVTLAKMANLPANTIIGNNTGSSAVPLALTVDQAQIMLAPTVTTNATTSITLDANVDTLNLTNTGARAVSIPAIVPGKIWTVKDAAFSALTGNITITPTAPILIDGQSSYIMLVNGASISIYTNGTDLFVM